ncbi:hypothetical protein C2G38_2235881 [Gigaspora rosea]|uniref:Uncharacterized protein n=1 Tax=Gigaspora rosea TaxID=44941 RepID=A0A397TY06_9GLOM|nr:hypothetical protein C2G38_2235881 [Gigaspora rosea]
MELELRRMNIRSSFIIKNQLKWETLMEHIIKNGRHPGMYNVGYCYSEGIRVKENKHKVFIFYQKSADMGDARGMYNVGYCYFNGIGIEKDEHKAFIQYHKLVEIGHMCTKGLNLVGYCYRNSIGVKKDENKAFERNDLKKIEPLGEVVPRDTDKSKEPGKQKPIWQDLSKEVAKIFDGATKTVISETGAGELDDMTFEGEGPPTWPPESY